MKLILIVRIFFSIQLCAQKTAQDYYNIGTDSKNNDDAIINFNKAIQIDSSFYKAYYSRGIAFFQKHDWIKALKDFSKTIELNSLYAEAYYFRGMIKNMLESNFPATAGDSDIIKAKSLGMKVPELILKNDTLK